MSAPAYVILEPVHYETNTPRGTEVFDFVPGRLDEPTDDERFVIEFALMPAGIAHRDGEAPPPPSPPAPKSADEAPAPEVDPEPEQES